MKKAMVALCASLITIGAFAQWKPAGDRIKTEWADKINPDKVLPEYPRPIMERAKWENLNGLWNYAIRPQADAKPDKFDGKILVPFAVESSLSGVMKNLGKEDALWYEREFTVPAEWKGQKVLLHFGAVDWSAQVWVNGKEIGTHTGGYAPYYTRRPGPWQGEGRGNCENSVPFCLELWYHDRRVLTIPTKG